MADTERAIPETGPLSLDDHAALLSQREEAEAAGDQAADDQADEQADTESPDDAGEAVAAEGEQDSEADTQSAEESDEAPETDTLEADEEAQNDDPAEPTLDPPARWEAEDKAVFAALPKKAQEVILRREKMQQAEVTKAQQKAAETSKTFETRIKHLNDVATSIGENYVEPGLKRMNDWEAWFASEAADELARTDPAEFLAEQNRYRREQADLQRAVSAKDKAEREAFAAYTTEQSRLMAEIIPEFAGEDGGRHKQELATYLRTLGFEPERIRGISALEAAISFKSKKYDDLAAKYADKGGIEAMIRDAEKYRKAEAVAKKPPPPKPKAKAGPSAPASSQGHRPSSDEAALKTLMAKSSWTAEEHTRVMQLKAKLRK